MNNCDTEFETLRRTVDAYIPTHKVDDAKEIKQFVKQLLKTLKPLMSLRSHLTVDLEPNIHVGIYDSGNVFEMTLNGNENTSVKFTQGFFKLHMKAKGIATVTQSSDDELDVTIVGWSELRNVLIMRQGDIVNAITQEITRNDPFNLRKKRNN